MDGIVKARASRVRLAALIYRRRYVYSDGRDGTQCHLSIDVSEDSTSNIIVSPVRVVTKICIPPQRRRTKGRDKDRLLPSEKRWRTNMESGLLWDVIIRKGAAVLELLAAEDEALLVEEDTFLVLDLGLQVIDGV